MNKHIHRCLAVAMVFLMIMTIAAGCASSKLNYAERSVFLFDTLISIKLWCDDDANLMLDEAFELCNYCDSIFDRNEPDSDIGRINRSGGLPCTVNEDTIQLLEMALEYSRLSDGMFDVTCGRVTALWDFSSDNPIIPDRQELDEALSTVDWRAVTIDGNTVTVPDGTEIDLGGIAKGYIADRVIDLLRAQDVLGAVVNLGGNVSVLGSKNGQPYRVGIQSPFDEGGTIGALSVTDCSVVTAGSYQRCFELDGSLYHHILDLSDGMPAQTGLSSVTIIARDSVQADSLATICFLLGEKDGLSLIESLDGVEAIFISSDSTVTMTEGAQSIYQPY